MLDTVAILDCSFYYFRGENQALITVAPAPQ